MVRKKSVFKSILLRWMTIFLCLILFAVIFMIRSRPVIISYAKTRAQSIMVSAFDEAVRHAISRLDYSYYDLAVITRTGNNLVSSIQIDFAKLNTLRAEISKAVHEIMCEKSNNTVYIPLGSLLGNEYTAGYGPGIKFKMQFTDISRLDFESSFYSAGINNVLHQINIKADLSYSIIMHGADETFSVGMTAVAAQTVIAGAIPENFTNVVETPDSNVADDIFNFAN